MFRVLEKEFLVIRCLGFRDLVKEGFRVLGPSNRGLRV